MKLKQVTNFYTNGIFYNLQNKNAFEWLTNGHVIDILYYGHYSGDKEISPLYADLIKAKEDGNIQDVMSTLCDCIIEMFGENWNRLHTALYIDYNPIENYDGNEEETISNDTTTKVKTDINTETGNKFFGFNSAGGKDNGSSNVHVTGSDDNNKSNTQGESTRTLHKHGNMGVTTSQQMIESELELRKNKFYEAIFADLDSLVVSGFTY